MADVTAWWGAITGSLALSWNAWYATRSSMERIRVEPEVRRQLGGVPNEFRVHVRNLSGFDVTIESAGLVGVAEDGGRLESMLEGFSSRLPILVAPRSSAQLNLSMRGTIELALTVFDHAYVVTATGKTFRSSKRHPLAGKTLGEMQRSPH